MRLWMICYDISDARRRRQITQALADAGAYRVQESVFEGCFVRRDLNALVASIAPVVRDDGGSLRIYPVAPSAASRRGYGRMPGKTEEHGPWLC